MTSAAAIARLRQLIAKRREWAGNMRLPADAPAVGDAEQLYDEALGVQAQLRRIAPDMGNPIDAAYGIAAAQVRQVFTNYGVRSPSEHWSHAVAQPRTFSAIGTPMGSDWSSTWQPGSDDAPSAGFQVADGDAVTDESVGAKATGWYREGDRWREYLQRGRHQLDDEMQRLRDRWRAAAFEETLQFVLTPDQYDLWRARRSLSLAEIGALEGVSAVAVWKREQKLLQHVVTEWRYLYPDEPLPAHLLRRPLVKSTSFRPATSRRVREDKETAA